MNHGGVQRLIQIRAGHRDVILETPGDGPPNLMDYAERGVAIFHRIGDHAHGQQIVNLIDHPLLLLNFQVQRVKALDAALHFGGNSVLDHLVANGVLHFVKKLVEVFLLRGEFSWKVPGKLPFRDIERRDLRVRRG